MIDQGGSHLHLTGVSSAPGPRPGFPYFELSEVLPMKGKRERERSKILKVTMTLWQKFLVVIFFLSEGQQKKRKLCKLHRLTRSVSLLDLSLSVNTEHTNIKKHTDLDTFNFKSNACHNYTHVIVHQS